MSIYSSSSSTPHQYALNDCREKLEIAIQKLEDYKNFVADVMQAPTVPGLVISCEPRPEDDQYFIWVLVSGQPVRLTSSKHIDPGNYVGVISGKGIVGEVSVPVQLGPIVEYVQRVNSRTIEVVNGGQSQIVFLPENELGHEERGARVGLDATGHIAITIIPPTDSQIAPEFDRVSFAEIGGHKTAKALIEQAVLWPVRHRAILERYNQRPSKGILFAGPPGCGKTMLAKATATMLANEYSSHAIGFFSVKGPELMDPYVGVTERKIRELFKAARKHYDDHGSRAVIFIDEADSCLGQRGRRLHSDISVPMFLTEMDGLSSAGSPLVILATNRADDLDQAIVREGRVDFKVMIERPAFEDVDDLFKIYLRKTVIDKATTVETLATASATLVREQSLWAKRSGAMIASLVDRATSKAVQRDISNGQVTGVSFSDCEAAINEAADQQEAMFS